MAVVNRCHRGILILLQDELLCVDKPVNFTCAYGGREPLPPVAASLACRDTNRRMHLSAHRAGYGCQVWCKDASAAAEQREGVPAWKLVSSMITAETYSRNVL